MTKDTSAILPEKIGSCDVGLWRSQEVLPGAPFFPSYPNPCNPLKLRRGPSPFLLDPLIFVRSPSRQPHVPIKLSKHRQYAKYSSTSLPDTENTSSPSSLTEDHVRLFRALPTRPARFTFYRANCQTTSEETSLTVFSEPVSCFRPSLPGILIPSGRCGIPFVSPRKSRCMSPSGLSR